MKATYKGYEAKERNAFTELPPAGAYIGQIMAVNYLPQDGEKQQRDQVELMIEITEGAFANRFTDVWKDQKEKWGDNVQYKGVFRLTPPVDGDDDWRFRFFEENLWCVEQSNPGYQWDWDEKKLKGKKIGFSLREKLYNYTDKETGEIKDGSTVEIARLETVQDVKDGKVKLMKPRDQRKKREESTADADAGFTQVDDADMPWAK